MGHKSVAVVLLPEIVHNGKYFNIEHLCKIAGILDFFSEDYPAAITASG
jgi:hypothetical protein